MARRVLSVQSHVAHGYVGNKAATFPLQLLGFDVDPLNTVQFSNHTGYPSFSGLRLEGDQLQGIFEGLAANGVLSEYSHVLTGYVGRPSSLDTIVTYAAMIRQKNPNTTIFIDPVMGDNGKMYVPPELLPIYRDRLLGLADIVTPNAFEAELLTGIAVTSVETAFKALDKIHELGPRIAIITSSELAGDAGNLHLFASMRSSQPESESRHFQITFAKLPSSFTGTGDLFAALLLGHLGHAASLTMDGLAAGCEKAVWTIQQVLKETMRNMAEQQSRANGDLSGNSDACLVRWRELRIVQSAQAIMNPSRVQGAVVA
ncbi:Ribokinase-like protein [Entophlyctis helioformis]|nr:Ribokinase-like protein [Entophlyctis helioformis]